jgi:16S rRNA (cytidine1402-2'-O)-methyltransferase
LENREDIAVISDAGTPGISDPAYYFVKQAVKENINVVPVPGCSALLAALVVSGLSTNRFVFEGFLPVKKGRKKRLGYLSDEERTIVLYESPHRLLRTLKDLLDYLGNRKISISRELTKMYEEVLHTNIEEALTKFENRDIKGEFVLVIEGKPRIN